MDEKKGGQWYWQCRLWWPQHLTAAHPEQAMALLGWASLSSASGSLDLVIAAACPFPSSGSFQDLEGVLKKLGERMQNQLSQATALEAAPGVVGQYLPPCICDKKLQIEDNSYLKVWHNGSKSSYDENSDSQQNCVDGSKLGQNRLSLATDVEATRCTCVFAKKLTWGPSIWAAATLTRSKHSGCNIPTLSYVVVDGIQYNANTHVILYEQPQIGRGHLSCRTWSSAFLAKQDCNEGILKPHWVVTLEKQQSAIDIDRVVEQLNCGAFIASTVGLYLGTSCMKESFLSKLWWQTLAFVVASIATMLYLFAWAGSRLLDKWLPAVPGMRCMQNTSHTWHALQLRCHQLLSWPFILLWGGNGPEQANVGMAHRCRQAKHATWTAAVVDMAMGAVAGVLVVRHQSWIAHFVQRMVRMLTNDILRTGCIWLMGVPAGFKLNDELAARLGTLSLHVIQTWATVGVLVRPALRICLPVLGLLAMLLGITVPAAILVDTILLGTIHIAILHQATASLYANQLRALAALWRLFRGSKRNPLRGRQDTYDCSVEQLVAGSLMFTPLLLLLPTTSVFYTFFTLIYSVLSIIRLCLQYLILILQSFPYSQVVLWLFQPQMFPSGIWFQVVCMDHDVQMSSSFQSLPTKNGHRYHNTRRNCGLQETVASESSSYMKGFSEEGVLVTRAVCGKAQAPTTLVSRLGVERASLGELLAPFVEQLKGVCPLSSAVALMYKLVSGGRIPGALELEMGEKLPYTLVSIPMFWRLCYEAVIMTLHNQ